jgi:hypothetical protein
VTAFEIEMLGAVSQFNGNLEIIPYAVKRVGVKPAVAPQVITTGRITASGESLEGTLVKIVNARILSGTFPPAGGSGNLTIDDGSGACTMRIDGDTDIDGQPTPADKIDIVGIVNQFDSALPYADGYQVLPRRTADISLSTSVGAESDHERPRQYRLTQNHPNPFWRDTEIRFSLPREANVQVEIFSLLGERVALLVDEKLAAGEHRVSWDGRQTGKILAGGIYFCRLQVETKNATWAAVKKMILLP